MVIPDVNILLYAYNPDAVQNKSAAVWLENQLASREMFGITWLTLWAFVRLGSNPKVWPHPPSVSALFDRIDEWLSLPNVIMVHPGPRHRTIFGRLVIETGGISGLASDAALAAIAIEHAATLASSDRDFRKFSGLRWVNPLDPE